MAESIAPGDCSNVGLRGPASSAAPALFMEATASCEARGVPMPDVQGDGLGPFAALRLVVVRGAGAARTPQNLLCSCTSAFTRTQRPPRANFTSDPLASQAFSGPFAAGCLRRSNSLTRTASFAAAPRRSLPSYVRTRSQPGPRGRVRRRMPAELGRMTRRCALRRFAPDMGMANLPVHDGSNAAISRRNPRGLTFGDIGLHIRDLQTYRADASQRPFHRSGRACMR